MKCLWQKVVVNDPILIVTKLLVSLSILSPSIILILIVSQKLPVRQLDVKNALLQGHHHETIYMQQPLEFQEKKFMRHFFLLHVHFMDSNKLHELVPFVCNFYLSALLITDVILLVYLQTEATHDISYVICR